MHSMRISNPATPGEPRDGLVQGTSLADIVRLAWEHKIKLVLIMVACMALGVAYALTAPKVYRAEVLFWPRPSSSVAETLGSGSGGAAGALSSLLGAQSSTEEGRNLAFLKSGQFSRTFIERTGIIDQVLADAPPESARTLRTAQEVFESRIRKIVATGEPGLYRVVIEHGDQDIVAEWANELVELGNELLRASMVSEAEERLKFYRGVGDQEMNLGVQRLLADLMKRELQSLAIASADQEYAFMIIDPAVRPLRPAKPMKVQIVLLSGIAGSILCALLLAIIAGRRRYP